MHPQSPIFMDFVWKPDIKCLPQIDDITYLVEKTKSTDTICLTSKDLAVSNSWFSTYL